MQAAYCISLFVNDQKTTAVAYIIQFLFVRYSSPYTVAQFSININTDSKYSTVQYVTFPLDLSLSLSL